MEFCKAFKIVTSNMITKTVRARRNKNKRIDKKWLKKYGYKTVPDVNRVFINYVTKEIMMHPVTFENIYHTREGCNGKA